MWKRFDKYLRMVRENSNGGNTIKQTTHEIITKYNRRMITLDDVKGFFRDLIFKLDLNFHPDNDMADYVLPTGMPMFDLEDSDKLNDMIGQAIKVCDENCEDVYGIGMEIMDSNIQGWMNKMGEAFSGGDELNEEDIEKMANYAIADATGNSPAHLIASAIESTIRMRMGLHYAWDQIDDDMKDEIRRVWINIIEKLQKK
jgi:hypothetical protein